MEDRDRMIQRRSPLNAKQKRLMLAVLVRQPEAFELAAEQLQPEQFADDEREYRLIWRTTVDFYEEHEELPGKEELLAELQARIEDDAEALEDDEVERMDELVGRIYAITVKSLRVKVGLGYLRRFLYDRMSEQLRSLFRVGDATPMELGEHLVEAVEQSQRIDSLQGTPVEEAFPDNWNDEPPVLKKRMGFPWLDDFLNGGDAAKEVYGYAAPFGSCKTVLAVQISARAARQFAMEFDQETGEPVLKLSYHVTYEEPVQMLRVRALSYVGMIDREHLESGKDSDLSGPDNPHKYEREMFRFNDAPLRCERSRRDLAQKWLNFNWRLIDFTGQEPGKEHLGAGMVPELVQAIRFDLKQWSHRTGFRTEAGKIVVDYAGMACKRWLEAKGIPESQELRQKLGKLPYDCKRMLAARFKCPVHIFAQLSGTVAGNAPGVVCRKTDTAENKLLLENCDFGITIGNMTSEQVAVASLQKARRGRHPRHAVIKVNGALCRVEDMNRDLVYYEKGRRIMTREELTRIDAGAGGMQFRNGRPVRPKRKVLRQQRRAMTE